LLPTFIIELQANFQLEVSGNNVIFSPAKFTDPLKSMGFMDPSLRTADLGDKSTEIYLLLDRRWIGWYGCRLLSGRGIDILLFPTTFRTT